MMKNVLEYLEETANKFPDKVAFSDPKESVTFSQLRNQAKSIASGIISITGGQKGHRVAVAVDRTVRSLVSFMGVIYSGGCYVPIDIQMPIERMKIILETSQPAAIIDGMGKRSLPKELYDNYHVISYSELVLEDHKETELKYLFDIHTDMDPLYLIFTSGSTGMPKGVCVSHRAVIDFTDWLTDTMNVTYDDVLGNQAPFYFDMAGKDIYQTIKTGCTTYIFPHMMFSFTGKLMKELNDKKVTTLFWAAAAVRMVAASGALDKNPPKYIRKMGFGGEALPVCWLNEWKKAVPEIQFMNMYGPTEATIDCIYYLIDHDFTDDEVLPMGKACENMQVYLIDEEKKEIKEAGIIGEICVKGSGLALGYYNDPERTKNVFKQNPFNNAYTDIIYCTGDLAKYGEDGLIYFAGRKDNQIKHMGYRIELGEIETKVTSLSEIEVSVCIFDKEKDEIVMFYQGDISQDNLKVIISDKLPRYMIPNVICKKKVLPYNANNKIDRVKLKKEYLDGITTEL